jgi:membrane-associated protease RseP (regulator of RpoE activity)
MLDRGSLTLFRLAGIPIRAHWTLPIGALIFSGFRFAPAFWLAFFLLVLIHELGHATFVKAFRLRVIGIDITGFGGLCHWSGSATVAERGAIAWGGVLAQALLLVLTLASVAIFGRPRTLYAAEIVSVFTYTNVWLIGLNLLPVPPLDGAEAWSFVGYLIRGGKLPRIGGGSPAGRVWSPPPAPRRSAPKPPGPSWWSRMGSRKAPSNGGAKKAAPSDPQAQRELAEMLQRVAKEANRARR